MITITAIVTAIIAKMVWVAAGIGSITAGLAVGLKAIADNPISRVMFAIALSVVFFTILLGFLPTTTELPPPTEIADGITWMVDGLYAFDWLIPVNLLLFCLTTVLAMQVIFVMLKIVMWIKKHVTQQH